MTRVLIARSTPKGPSQPNEDALLVTDGFLAIFDGATEKSPTQGDPPGLRAVRALTVALGALPPRSTKREAIDALSAAITPKVRRDDDASAAVLIYSPHWRQVWVVGDGWVNVDGVARRLGHLAERQAAAARATYLTSLLRSGHSIGELRRGVDPGRKMILPMLQAERYLRNVDHPNRLFWGAIDGNPVPDRHIVTIDVPRRTQVVVLASDGYPQVGTDYSAAEAHLSRRIARDPLMIASSPATKGVQGHQGSYDDRSWLQFRP